MRTRSVEARDEAVEAIEEKLDGGPMRPAELLGHVVESTPGVRETDHRAALAKLTTDGTVDFTSNADIELT